MIGGIFI